MIKKSFSLLAILAIAGTTVFAQGPNVDDAEDVEKADRFRAVQSEAATEDAGSDTASSEEGSLASQAGEENPFDLSQGVDPLEVLGGSAQLEDLGVPRFCWACRWICC